MSSIAGFFQPNTIYSKDNEFCGRIIHKMSDALLHRGPDEQSFYFFPHGAFNHNFLLAGYIPSAFPREIQPLTRMYHEHNYTLFFDGFISNIDQIAENLTAHGDSVLGMSVEEILLLSFVKHGTDFIKELRGGFAMAIYDEHLKTLYLFRDALGLRPLFYCHKGHTIVFASEIKAIFQYPGICPTLNEEGLTELLGLGPARRPGSAVFAGISEVKPGHFLTFNRNVFLEERYHQFHIHEHTDSYEDTMEHITELLDQSIHSLKTSVLPSSCLLSGGLDSSVVTAKLSQIHPTTEEYRSFSKQSRENNNSSLNAQKKTISPSLATYSLEFDNSRQHFKANAFQPALDAPFVQQMVTQLGTKHTVYTCDSATQLKYLKKSVEAHDLPTMADVDASYLYFCKKVGKQHKIVFTGECADEIFCGYPWYHNSKEDPQTFPWSKDLLPRQVLLKGDIISSLPIEEYVRSCYLDTCAQIGINGEQTPGNLLHQKTFYLTIRYFMQTLVNRGDRATAFYQMDARVPFANQELTEYLFNVPFEMKVKNGERKHLLREYAKNLLPDEIRLRKKSPYPKTYDPEYEALVNRELLSALNKKDCPLLEFLDKNKVTNFCLQVKDLGRPWYGQLMAGPQLVAYYLQILYWLEMYHVELCI